MAGLDQMSKLCFCMCFCLLNCSLFCLIVGHDCLCTKQSLWSYKTRQSHMHYQPGTSKKGLGVFIPYLFFFNYNSYPLFFPNLSIHYLFSNIILILYFSQIFLYLSSLSRPLWSLFFSKIHPHFFYFKCIPYTLFFHFFPLYFPIHPLSLKAEKPLCQIFHSNVSHILIFFSKLLFF